MGHHDSFSIKSEAEWGGSLFDVILLRSWWVAVFILLCVFLYDKAVLKRHEEEERLQKKLTQLEIALAKTQAENTALRLRIASQEDPASLELILLSRLGMVPEDHRKVIFPLPAP